MADPKIIVIGGGAAGLFAAGQAASQGIPTQILEKQKELAKKLSISGMGRCNLTNIAPLPEFLERFGKNGRFLRQAFNQFFSNELVEFLSGLGLDIQVERGGRIFPANNDAPAVVKALISWVNKQGVKINLNSSVEKLIVKDNRITAVLVDGKNIPADIVILATGGVSYPGTGSTGDGYRLTEEIGHTIIPIRPALIGLKTTDRIAGRMEGLLLKNVNASVFIDGKKRHQKFGEMMFMPYGLNGAIIRTLSRSVVDAMKLGSKVVISIDLKPALDDKKLEARLLRDLKSLGKQSFHTLLKGLLPSKMIKVASEVNEIPLDKECHQVSAVERRRLRNWLKDFRFEINGHRSKNEAIVTAGGLKLKEINPRTMASRLIPNLYFAGELIDIDGETGGFNLQAAFSTGRLAGQSAADSLK